MCSRGLFILCIEMVTAKEIEGSMNDILQLQSLWLSEKFQMRTGTVQMGTWFSSINLNRAFGPWHPSRWQQFTFLFFFWGDFIGFCHDQLPNRSNVERGQLLGLMVSNVLVFHGGSWGRREEAHTEARKQDERMPVFMDTSFSCPLLIHPEPGLLPSGNSPYKSLHRNIPKRTLIIL